MLKEEAFDICEKLLSKQAHFYVCGDVKMADDVCKTLQVIWNTPLLRFCQVQLILWARCGCIVIELPNSVLNAWVLEKFRTRG